MGRFSGKAAIVTGAGRGLGQRVALLLAREGANVLGLGRSQWKLDRLTALAADIDGDGSIETYACDLGVAEEVDAAFKTAERLFGRLDILINNAAIYDFYKVAEATPERIKATIDANILGPALCIRAAVPLMKTFGRGDVINITSESVRNPYAFLTMYAATKAGLENMSSSLNKELRGDNIRVTALRLGTMADDDREVKMDIDTARRFMEENMGALSTAGSEMSYDTVAETIADLLCLKSDAAFDFLELRPSGLRQAGQGDPPTS